MLFVKDDSVSAYIGKFLSSVIAWRGLFALKEHRVYRKYTSRLHLAPKEPRVCFGVEHAAPSEPVNPFKHFSINTALLRSVNNRAKKSCQCNERIKVKGF